MPPNSKPLSHFKNHTKPYKFLTSRPKNQSPKLPHTEITATSPKQNKNTKSIPLRYKFGTLASYSANHSHNTIKSIHSLKCRHSISTLSSKINSKPWNQRYNRKFRNKIFCLNILSFNKPHIKILICTFKYEQSLMQIKSANKLHSITYKTGKNICLIFILI